MTDARLKNIDRFIDRHGKPRHYYRAGKGARVRLPGEPGNPEFLLAYKMAAQHEGSVKDEMLLRPERENCSFVAAEEPEDRRAMPNAP